MNLGRLGFLLGIALLLAAALRAFIAEGIYIASGSMEPLLPVGTHVVMDKMTLRFRDPRRNDIVVFSSPVDGKEDLVKRVIGIPGDTVELKEKRLLINGVAQTEDYAQHTRLKETLTGDSLGPVTVPNEHLFVLGDNRDESNDSSVWRDPKSNEPIYFVPYSKIRGLVRGFY